MVIGSSSLCLAFYLLAVGTWYLALGHYGDALAKG